MLVSAAPAAAVTTTVNAANVLHPRRDQLMGINSDLVGHRRCRARRRSKWPPPRAQALSLSRRIVVRPVSFQRREPTTATRSAITIPQFAQFISAAGGIGLVTLDYGSGSPQEAAAELAYLEGSPSDTTGDRQRHRVERQHQPMADRQLEDRRLLGQPAGRRAAGPRRRTEFPADQSHAAPFTGDQVLGSRQRGIRELGSRSSRHGSGRAASAPAHSTIRPPTSPSPSSSPRSPPRSSADAGLPAISIGIDSGDPTGGSDNNWTQERAHRTGLAIGFVPGLHLRPQLHASPGQESDSFLLNNTVSNAHSDLRLVDALRRLPDRCSSKRSAARRPACTLMATEFNSVYLNPGKQSTSLVNGLFIANSLGSLLDSGYAAATSGTSATAGTPAITTAISSTAGGKAGDYGILGAGRAKRPALRRHLRRLSRAISPCNLPRRSPPPAAQVVSAASNYGDLDVYAVQAVQRRSRPAGDQHESGRGHHRANSTSTGFQPAGPAQVWQYGKTKTRLRAITTNGAASLANSSTTLSLNGANFSYTFPAYSMTVLDLKVAQVLTSISVSLASSNLATNGTEQFAATALDQFGNPMTPQPTFNWQATGGQIARSGLFTPSYTSGTATIQATSGGITGSMNVTLPARASWIAASCRLVECERQLAEHRRSAAIWRCPACAVFRATVFSFNRGRARLST